MFNDELPKLVSHSFFTKRSKQITFFALGRFSPSLHIISYLRVKDHTIFYLQYLIPIGNLHQTNYFLEMFYLVILQHFRIKTKH